VRSLVSLPAGAEHMPLARFSVFTIAGSALWNAVLIGLGWLLGSRYDLVDQYSGWLNWIVVAAVVGLVAWLVVRRVRHGSRTGSAPTPGRLHGAAGRRELGHRRPHEHELEHQRRSALMREQLPD
jgi:hypothetical protein